MHNNMPNVYLYTEHANTYMQHNASKYAEYAEYATKHVAKYAGYDKKMPKNM